MRLHLIAIQRGKANIFTLIKITNHIRAKTQIIDYLEYYLQDIEQTDKYLNQIGHCNIQLLLEQHRHFKVKFVLIKNNKYVAITSNEFVVINRVQSIPSTTQLSTLSIASLPLKAYSIETESTSEDDISFNFDSVSKLDWITNSSYTISIGLTCSISGLIAIDYSLDNSTGSVPSWVSLDTSSWTLNIDTAGIAVGTTASFNIQSLVSSNSTTYFKAVTLQVIGWNVSNWVKWDPSSTSTWKVWSSGYLSTSGGSICEKEIISKTLDLLAMMALIAACSIILVELLSGIFSWSPFQIVWIIINNFQLLLHN